MSKRDVKQITLRLPLEVDEALKEISEITSIIESSFPRISF